MSCAKSSRPSFLAILFPVLLGYLGSRALALRSVGHMIYGGVHGNAALLFGVLALGAGVYGVFLTVTSACAVLLKANAVRVFFVCVYCVCLLVPHLLIFLCVPSDLIYVTTFIVVPVSLLLLVIWFYRTLHGEASSARNS